MNELATAIRGNNGSSKENESLWVRVRGRGRETVIDKVREIERERERGRMRESERQTYTQTEIRSDKRRLTEHNHVGYKQKY